MTETDRFLGFAFDTVTQEEAIERILEWSGSDQPFRYVVTPNVSHVAQLSREPEELRGPFTDAPLCLCDSRVLELCARAIAGRRLSVVTGSDLTPALMPELARRDVKVAIIGSDAGDADRLRALYPGLQVVYYGAPMGLRHDRDARAGCIRFLVRETPDVTLLCVGMPQQEIIAHEARGQARGVALCTGASVDFLVGRQTRAPRLLQRMKLEWLHRLLSDPRRLARRYILDFPVLLRLLSEERRRRDP